MGRIGKALNTLMGNQTIEPDLPSMLESGRQRNDVTDIAELSMLELLYHLYEEDGLQMVGKPDSVFAAYDEERGVLTVLAERDNLVEIIPYRSTSTLAALECAQEEGASFTICGKQVICVLKDVSAQGSSYGDAALRALLKHQLTSRQKKSKSLEGK